MFLFYFNCLYVKKNAIIASNSEPLTRQNQLVPKSIPVNIQVAPLSTTDI